MHIVPFAVAACCAGLLQADVATTPIMPQSVETWAVETVVRGFGHHSADADATASRGGDLAGNGWVAFGDLKQKWQKAHCSGTMVIAPPEVHKTGESPERWRVDMPVYVWGCFGLPHREDVAPRENPVSRCPNRETRSEYMLLRLSILGSSAGTRQDFTLESMVAQP